jgi:hypothetical protein
MFMPSAHFLEPVLHGPGRYGLRVERSGAWLAVDLELAGTSSSRRRGLVGRDRLAAGHVLVIAPSQGVHTFGMRFAIDVVGVSRRGQVVSIRRGVVPRRSRLRGARSPWSSCRPGRRRPQQWQSASTHRCPGAIRADLRH